MQQALYTRSEYVKNVSIPKIHGIFIFKSCEKVFTDFNVHDV